MDPFRRASHALNLPKQAVENKTLAAPPLPAQSVLAIDRPTHQTGPTSSRLLSQYRVGQSPISPSQISVSSSSIASNHSNSAGSSSSSSSSSPILLAQARQLPMQLNDIRKLLRLSSSSQKNQDAVYAELGERISLVVTAATALHQPKTAKIALDLLTALTTGSEAKSLAIWAAMSEHEKKTLVIAATNLRQPSVSESALIFLSNLTAESKIIRDQLWATQIKMGPATLLAPLTGSMPSKIVASLYDLLGNLALGLEARTTALWSALGKPERAALVSAASTPQAPMVTASALRLLGNLGLNSETRTSLIWASLGVAGRAAVITAATSPEHPKENFEALYFMVTCCLNSEAIKAEVCISFCAIKLAALINAATNLEQAEIAGIALTLLTQLQTQPSIYAATWPLLQPQIAQLCTITQPPDIAQKAKHFLLQQIRGDALRTSQVLNALNAAVPAIPMHQIIDILRGWCQFVSYHLLERTALLTGIVQANITAQKIGVFTAAALSGINFSLCSQAERQALRDHLLSAPLATDISSTLYRQHIRLGFDAACSSTAEVLGSKVLSESGKLKLLEILYLSSGFINSRATNEHLLDVLDMRDTAKISRGFSLQAIEIILKNGKLNSTQFNTVLAWLEDEFEKDKYTVFTNPATLEDIGDLAIYALAEQRQQYLALYQSFRPHITRDFIQAEIVRINHRVEMKEMPENFGSTLIFQLQQFLATTVVDTAVGINHLHDRKSESK